MVLQDALRCGTVCRSGAVRPRWRPARGVQPLRSTGAPRATAAPQTEEGPKQGRKRRLVLLRHADAVPRGEGVDDKARVLSERGRKEAAQVASALLEKNPHWMPDLVLASDSARTRETLQLMAARAPALRRARTVFVPEFYENSGDGAATVGAMFAALRAHATSADATALLLGHNPGWEEAAAALAGAADVAPLRTAEAVLLKCERRDWAEVLATEMLWEARSLWEVTDTVAPPPRKAKAPAEAKAAAPEADDVAEAPAAPAAKGKKNKEKDDADAKQEQELESVEDSVRAQLAAAVAQAAAKKKSKAAKADAAAAAAEAEPAAEDAVVPAQEQQAPPRASGGKKKGAADVAKPPRQELSPPPEDEALLVEGKARKARRKAAEAAASAAWALAKARTTQPPAEGETPP